MVFRLPLLVFAYGATADSVALSNGLGDCDLACILQAKPATAFEVEKGVVSARSSSGEAQIQHEDDNRNFPSVAGRTYGYIEFSSTRELGGSNVTDADIVEFGGRVELFNQRNEKGDVDRNGQFVQLKIVYSDDTVYYDHCVWVGRRNLKCVDSEDGTYQEDFHVVSFKSGTCTPDKLQLSLGRGTFPSGTASYVGVWYGPLTLSCKNNAQNESLVALSHHVASDETVQHGMDVENADGLKAHSYALTLAAQGRTRHECTDFPSVVDSAYDYIEYSSTRELGASNVTDADIVEFGGKVVFFNQRNENGDADSNGQFVQLKIVYSDDTVYYDHCVWMNQSTLKCVDSEDGSYQEDFHVVSFKSGTCTPDKLQLSLGRGTFPSGTASYVGVWYGPLTLSCKKNAQSESLVALAHHRDASKKEHSLVHGKATQEDFWSQLHDFDLISQRNEQSGCTDFPFVAGASYDYIEYSSTRELGASDVTDADIVEFGGKVEFFNQRNEKGDADSNGQFVQLKIVYSDDTVYYDHCVWMNQSTLKCVDSEDGSYQEDFHVVSFKSGTCTPDKLRLSLGRGKFPSGTASFVGVWYGPLTLSCKAKAR